MTAFAKIKSTRSALQAASRLTAMPRPAGVVGGRIYLKASGTGAGHALLHAGVSGAEELAARLHLQAASSGAETSSHHRGRSTHLTSA